MRNIGTAFGFTSIALQSVMKGLAKLEVDREALDAELERHWEVLAEPIQTVLRK